MLFSTFSSYGLRALVRLALLQKERNTPISIREIAAAENISAKYLEAIFALLKKNKIILAEKGKQGGYRLSRAIKKISLLKIIEALDGKLYMIKCISTSKNCAQKNHCFTHDLWHELNSDIREKLKKKTIFDLIEKERLMCKTKGTEIKKIDRCDKIL